MDTAFLDWALADFSGYVAADELYDGPFCILSAVDNRRYKRILYDVLDHDPTHEDIRAFLRRLQTALAARDLTLRGMTTDGSPLYPTPLAEVFSGVPHQLCQFHVVKEIVKAVVKAVARERKRLARLSGNRVLTQDGDGAKPLTLLELGLSLPLAICIHNPLEAPSSILKGLTLFLSLCIHKLWQAFRKSKLVATPTTASWSRAASMANRGLSRCSISGQPTNSSTGS
jgi:hypothetical protein